VAGKIEKPGLSSLLNSLKSNQMKINFALAVLFPFTVLFAQAQLITPDKIQIKKKTELTIQPVKHATLVLSYDNKTIYVDPTGDAELYEGLPDPDMILITDINKDHFDLRTLESIHTANAVMVVPEAVADLLPDLLIKKELVIFHNGDMRMLNGIGVAAIARYNLPETEDAYYTRDRGNGYVVGIGGKNIYISGETDAIPEMKELRDIDIAFVCMNLPNTMNAQQAAETVLQFKPAIVYPYDYLGQDITSFKTIVNDADKNIDVRIRNWYPAGSTAALSARQ
jgi:L-ascorbate metabolism protein UlaG (beta-lactamase superfamily)